jgi:hypothetical protein
MRLEDHRVQAYLSARLGREVRLLRVSPLDQPRIAGAVKGYGYGVPVRVDFELNGEPRSAVIGTLSPGPFGHEHMADRAQILLSSHHAFNALPRHVRSLDVGGFTQDGALVSLGEVTELFALNEYVEGREYVRDLELLRKGDDLTDLDLARADALCDYLVEVHRVPGPDPGLYVRRIRELVGHGECIMGIIDAYPAGRSDVSAGVLEEIEHEAVRWRWRLKSRTHRLRRVHGDFHPWNVLFREGTDFTVLDRSRGEWGDPADDVACITMNYLFFSLQRSGALEGSLGLLFRRFWRRYLEKSGDREMLEVVAPFMAFRGLVMANPVWYPALDRGIRLKLLALVREVLASAAFDPEAAAAHAEV